MRKRNLVSLLAATLLALTALAAAAAYPAKPFRFIVPFPAGSGTDSAARVLGQWLTTKTGQPVVVENRPGANGFIAAQAAAGAEADGHTVFLTTNTTVVGLGDLESAADEILAGQVRGRVLVDVTT